ncbi:hypothetical protein [Nocardia sp. NPDC059239]|uniref:hypothetical protein n=1 Tax=unclassified Nocardia TaxID=2637762 RepID=UPI00368A6B52
MATQIAPDIDSIEHLDHEMGCDSPAHDGVPPPADYWVDVHNGCSEHLLCAGCVQSVQNYLEDELRNGMDTRCNYCDGLVRSFTELYTRVVPL